MNRNRWQYLKDLAPSAPRMVHQSAAAGMVPDPRSAITGFALPLIPWVERPGKTYNVGRNRAKRERREAAKAARRRQVAGKA